MALLTWTPEEMKVGVVSLDRDHEQLILLINNLHDGIEANHARFLLEGTLDRLEEFVGTHLAHEERLFARTSFPGAAAHRSEHEMFARRVMNLRSRFESENSHELSLETLTFLSSWLQNHILISDKECGAFFKSRGIY